MKKRFALFAFNTSGFYEEGAGGLYPAGGWNDLQGIYETLDDACEATLEEIKQGHDWQIVDLEKGEVVEER